MYQERIKKAEHIQHIAWQSLLTPLNAPNRRDTVCGHILSFPNSQNAIQGILGAFSRKSAISPIMARAFRPIGRFLLSSSLSSASTRAGALERDIYIYLLPLLPLFARVNAPSLVPLFAPPKGEKVRFCRCFSCALSCALS